jgi:hypothetical protein
MLINWFRQVPRHATVEHTILGQTKMHWFFMRQHETELYLKKLPLREYAVMKSIK